MDGGNARRPGEKEHLIAERLVSRARALRNTSASGRRFWSLSVWAMTSGVYESFVTRDLNPHNKHILYYTRMMITMIIIVVRLCSYAEVHVYVYVI